LNANNSVIFIVLIECSLPLSHLADNNRRQCSISRRH